MRILALELSTARGSLAWLDGKIEFTCEWPNDRKNSAAFFENLQAARRKFGTPETITVGLGPGSYAGTRIAISAAKRRDQFQPSSGKYLSFRHGDVWFAQIKWFQRWQTKASSGLLRKSGQNESRGKPSHGAVKLRKQF